MRHQPRRLVERPGHDEDDEHLGELDKERRAEHAHRVQQAVGAVAAQQIDVQDAADEPFDGGRHGAGRGREAAQRIAMQADGESDDRAAEDAAEHGADGAGVGDGAFDLIAEMPVSRFRISTSCASRADAAAHKCRAHQPGLWL